MLKYPGNPATINNPEIKSAFRDFRIWYSNYQARLFKGKMK